MNVPKNTSEAQQFTVFDIHLFWSFTVIEIFDDNLR